MTIRKATHRDVRIIAGFNIAMARETESKTLDPGTILAGVTAVLNRPELGFYLVAELDGEVVASLMVSYEWSDWRNGLFWWIQSVFVVPEHRRKGLYTAMYATITEEIRTRPDVRGCRLYVERTNTGARTTYSRLGMVETTYRMYEMISGGE